MNILVFGAGVLGSLYAARLQEAGHDVSVLARGQRLADIQRYGLVLEDVRTGRQTTTSVRVVAEVPPNEAYDLVLVLIRKNQLANALPTLKQIYSPTLLFMLNNAEGPALLIRELDPLRVLLGFPGAGGTLENHLVRYVLIPQQRTTLGELSGQRTARTAALVQLFERAGFPAESSRAMDAWLKTHAVFVTAISGAFYQAGADLRRLADSPSGVPLLVRAVREGFRVLRARGVQVVPFKLRILFNWLPAAVPVAYWRRYFRSPMGEYAFARHSRAAGDELKQLADEVRQLKADSTVATPALDELYSAIDAFAGQSVPKQ